MKKLNLYDIDVLLLTPKRRERHVLYIAARNVKGAFIKASNRLAQAPHGYGVSRWKLTGEYKFLGRVFM